MGKHRDWTEIRDDYQLSGLSFAKIAEKYGVSITTLKKAAKREGWTKAVGHTEQVKHIAKRIPTQKDTKERTPRSEIPDGEQSFREAVDLLIEKAKFAAEVLPPLQVQALKQLSGVLKDLASLKGWDKDEYDRAEQQARIDKLRAETESAKREESGEIQIRIMGMSEEDIEEVIG